jgi:pimeloyl-ACP methyl ester carboxylesterase
MKRLWIFIILVFLMHSVFALKPVKKYDFKPENFGMIYKEFKATTSDNYKINVWFFPAQDSVPLKYVKNASKQPYKTLDNKKRPTIIVCPPDADNMARMFQYAGIMCPKGYNVVTFDWRGFGGSDKWPINKNYLCYTEFFMDIDAVVDKIKLLEEVDTSKIGICGYSMPAFQSFPVFQRRRDLKCYIGGALSADLDTIVGYWVKHGRPTIIPKDYTKDFYPMNVADKITKPCLLIVGELDEITPAKMVEQDVYNKLKGEKEIWIIKGVGHGAQWYNKDSFHNYVNRMVVFYDKYLK